MLHHASFALTSAGPVIWQALRWQPDLMISVAPSLVSAVAVAFMARRLGVPSWLHLQDFEIDAAFGLGLLKNQWLQRSMLAVEKRILGSFDRVSTIAPQMLRRLHEKGVDRTRLREMRNWTDTTDIVPDMRPNCFRDELGLKSSDIVALYSGTMSNKQGLDLIVEAARNVAPSNPGVHFVLAGDGPHKSKLRNMATDLPNVHFLPLQAGGRFEQLLTSADIHLIPQRSEAADLVLPSKLGGIFASGRPVITMAAPGTSLACEVEGAGLVIPPGDAGALAIAVCHLAKDFDLCRTLGRTGREYALARWDRTRILRTWENEFFALCGVDRAPAVDPYPSARSPEKLSA
jgi:colanic acid biosynthesis glycosyl transferase WcaI